MNYTTQLQSNISECVYTPYMIKPSNSNSSGYVSYIDLLKFGQVTDFGAMGSGTFAPLCKLELLTNKQNEYEDKVFLFPGNAADEQRRCFCTE